MVHNNIHTPLKLPPLSQPHLPLPTRFTTMPLLLARTPLSSLPPIPRHNYNNNNLLIAPSQKRFPLTAGPILLSTPRRILASSPLKCASINGVSVHNNPQASREQVYPAQLLERIRKWLDFLPLILPGGRWWEFSDDVDVQLVAQPVTVWRALGKMWELVARDRWVIFAAFSALIVAAVSTFFFFSFAGLFLFGLCPFCGVRRWGQRCELLLCGFQVSEISIPHFLTASIFSAQGADLTVFHRNVRVLVLLCVTSGICRSKSCMVESPFYLLKVI